MFTVVLDACQVHTACKVNAPIFHSLGRVSFQESHWLYTTAWRFRWNCKPPAASKSCPGTLNKPLRNSAMLSRVRGPGILERPPDGSEKRAASPGHYNKMPLIRHPRRKRLRR